MKSIIVLICMCLYTSFSSFGQEGISSGMAKHGKIDSVSQPEEVEALVHSIDKRYNSFRFNRILTFEDDNCFRLADLSKVKPIEKADFDKNGYTDMLVLGTLDGRSAVISLMGAVRGKINLHVITRQFRRTCSIARVIYEDGNTLLEFRYFDAYFARVSNEEAVKSVKLIFKYGDFIEYNPSPKNYDINKIEFRNDGGPWITSSEYSIEINSLGKAHLVSKSITKDWHASPNSYDGYTKEPGVSPDSLFATISGILNYSDFPNLKNRYEVKASDQVKGRLTIYYNNDKVKTITDYGLQGTYSLHRIYQIINSMRGSLVWKLKTPEALIPLPVIRN